MPAHRVFFIAATLGIFSLAGCSDPAPSPTAKTNVSAAATARIVDASFPAYIDTSEDIAEGGRLFAVQRCAECHSDAGVILGAGNGNIDLIATAIRDGREGGMPSYGGKLTDAQIWQIAAFVRALGTSQDGIAVGGVDRTAGHRR